MEFSLYKISGYEEAINSLRMSHGKYFSLPKAEDIQDLVYAVTDKKGFIASEEEYGYKVMTMTKRLKDSNYYHTKITGNYKQDVAEFERLLGLTLNNAMKEFDHHTLMKYIDISFFTVGLHRGAQDDLDAHALGFNNRITRYSTRLAEIQKPELSDWYKDKVMSFYDAENYLIRSGKFSGKIFPEFITTEEGISYRFSPFGYILEKYADLPKNNGLYKDVQRGLIPLGQEGPALWKSDLFNLRYIYSRRSKLTKANPELKIGMEQLADQIEKGLPVFGQYFRKVYTDSKVWEHTNKVRTISADEWKEFEDWKSKVKGGEPHEPFTD